MAKHSNLLTDHHITPKSRGGSKDNGNLKRVPEKRHVAYHALFFNLTPDEVIQYLKEVWFNPRGGFKTAEQWLAERS